MRIDDPVAQLLWTTLLALPVASISWTVTHEEIFRRARDYCGHRVAHGGALSRKFFYVFTCEYCFSHYVTALILLVTAFRLMLDDWRGVFLAFFAIDAVANLYMAIFGRLRVEIRSDRLDIAEKERTTGLKG